MSNQFNAASLKQVLGSISAIAGEVGALLAAAGVNGSFASGEAERIAALFGNLAAVAVQAAHDALGREVTPDSVLALLPTSTPLVPPVA